MAHETEELRNLEVEELETRLDEAKQTHFNLRFQHVTGQLDNSSRLGEVKRQVARIKTLLREREIAEAEALEAKAAPTTDRSDTSSTERSDPSSTEES
ncbi:MAG: large subunit ribosomal protein [Actinomycetota bacterium]|jgi:large subunit ribosomal protein L29|nr:large subunit ribosomal protein [Actinomycetota bacterium]